MGSFKLNERQQEIDTYLKGTTAIYGCVTHRQFLKLFNRWNEKRLFKDEFMKYAEKLNRLSYNFYCILSTTVIRTDVEKDIIERTIEQQKDKKYYDPTKDEIVNYASKNYYEKTRQVCELTDYLSVTKKISQFTVDSLVRNLVFAMKVDVKFQELFAITEKYGIRFSDETDLSEFMKYVTEVGNSTRKWSCCGFTKNELEAVK